MTVRTLPREQWSRVRHTPLGEALPLLPPDTEVLIVEDEAGAIVGTWAVLRYVHVHGFWIADAHRKRGAVLRRLLQGLRAAAERWGARAVMTSAETSDVAELIRRYGGRKLPGAPFVFPVGGPSCP